jgi:hypothetical protein
MSRAVAAAPVAPPAVDAYTVVAVVALVDETCQAHVATFGVTEFAVAGLLMWGGQEPLATVTAAIGRLETATVVSRDPQDWVY